MKRWSWIVVLLFLVGFLAPQAQADDRLKLTGFVDNHIRAARNFGGGDDDLTNDDDRPWEGRFRGRMFFNIQATEETKAVIAFEFDQKYGRARGDTSERSRNGYDLGADNGAFELKWLYVDGNIPGTPIRYKLGGHSMGAFSMRNNCFFLCADAAGISTATPLSDQVKLRTYFAWAEEDFAETVGDPDTLLGEEYFGGFVLELALLEGLDIQPTFFHQHLEDPVFSTGVLRVVTGTEDSIDRYYVGFDSRYRMGNLTAQLAFLYQFGKTDFQDGSDADIRSFVADLTASYVFGALKLTGRFVYTPGNDATDDFDGDGDDINYFQSIFVDTVHRSVQWFEIWGWNWDSTSTRGLYGFGDPRSVSDNLGFDQYGLIHGAVRADYQVNPKLSFTGALGFFAAAEDVGRSTRLGTGTDFDTNNFTGNDTYLGTEIDVWMSYQLYPRATINVWFAYAINGDATELGETCDANGCTGGTRSVDDSYGTGARMIYRF